MTKPHTLGIFLDVEHRNLYNCSRSLRKVQAERAMLIHLSKPIIETPEIILKQFPGAPLRMAAPGPGKTKNDGRNRMKRDLDHKLVMQEREFRRKSRAHDLDKHTGNL